MANANLPPSRARLVTPDGLTTREFYAFFNSIAPFAVNVTHLQDEIDALTVRVDALEADGGASFKLLGPMSVFVQGLPKNGGVVTLSLLNDILAPGKTKYYGTSTTGSRGWFAISNAFADSTNIAQSVDASGVSSFNLTDVTLTIGGTLAKYAFDTKGRLSETDSATTTDLPEGTNLYYTDVRADTRISLQKGQPNGLATLDASGLVPPAQIPPLAITDTFVVSSQVAMLALTAQTGDICIRTDLNETFILQSPPASTLSNWKQMLFPTSGVTSVFGRTGAVTAQTGDYAVAQVTGAVANTRAINTTAPITGGGDLSADRTLAIAAATASVDGYLAHADWATFNGKLSDAPNNGNIYARRNALWLAIASVTANSNGFQIGNVLVQIGSDSAPIPSSNNVTSKAVTFPVAYTTLLYAHATPTVAAVTSVGFNAVSATLSKSGTGFTAAFDSDSGGVAGAFINKIITFDWVAIGILPTIGTLTLTGTYPGASQGIPYSQSLAISGGVSPYSLTGGTGLSSGTLPAGLSLSIVGSNLVLSGTPTTLATNIFTVSINSTDAQTATSPQSVVVAAPSAWTFDPANTNAAITLSAANTVASRIATFGWVSTRGTVSHNSGKKIFAIQNTNNTVTNQQLMVGLLGAADPLTNFPGSSATSYGRQTDGRMWTNNGTIATLASTIVGNYIVVAVDFTAGKIWIGTAPNGGPISWGGTSDPATGTSPNFTFTAGTTLYPGVGELQATQVATIPPSISAIGLTMPTGYSDW